VVSHFASAMGQGLRFENRDPARPLSPAPHTRPVHTQHSREGERRAMVAAGQTSAATPVTHRLAARSPSTPPPRGGSRPKRGLSRCSADCFRPPVLEAKKEVAEFTQK
jgi:hypothetical protein